MRTPIALTLLALAAGCPRTVTVDDTEPAPPPIPVGASEAMLIGPEGGALALQGLELTIPAGALAEPTRIEVTAIDDRAPGTFTAYSPVFRFEPAGLTFATPASIRLPFDGDGTVASIFWTDDNGAFTARPTEVEGAWATTSVHHFSQAFVGTACAECCRQAAEGLDLLFVVDDSGSMFEEQAALNAEIPRLAQALATGDLDGDGVQEFPAIGSLHVGIISTDLGTGPGGACSGSGRDGILVDDGDALDPSCSATYPAWLEPATGAPIADFAGDVGCVAGNLGTDGCGFEQHLEATLKALTPSTSGMTFAGGTTGHGDGANAGFLREDAVLAVIELTDEDDCSASDLGLFDTAAPEYTPNINLRCTEHPEALQALARFRDGLLALKADPTQVVFTTISGIPVDLQGATYADMLADPRMQLTPDPDNSTQLLPSCETPNGIAYPSRRLIGMAQELESAGAKTAVTSICDTEFDGAVAVILEQVAAGVSGSCE